MRHIWSPTALGPGHPNVHGNGRKLPHQSFLRTIGHPICPLDMTTVGGLPRQTPRCSFGPGRTFGSSIARHHLQPWQNPGITLQPPVVCQLQLPAESDVWLMFAAPVVLRNPMPTSRWRRWESPALSRSRVRSLVRGHNTPPLAVPTSSARVSAHHMISLARHLLDCASRRIGKHRRSSSYSVACAETLRIVRRRRCDDYETAHQHHPQHR